MSSIFDIGKELLKAFLAPQEEMIQTEGLSERNLKAMLEHKGISDFLMYRYYESFGKLGTYHMADGRMGYIMRVFPSSMSSNSIEESVFNMIDTLKEEGTVIHINTVASRNIGYLVDSFRDLHQCNVNVKNVSMLKEIVDDQVEFFRKGINESIVDGVDLRVRDFVCTVSVLLPKGTKKAAVRTSYNQMEGILRKFNPINFSGSQLVSLTKELLNPNGRIEDWNMSYDKNKVMNKQISSVGTKVNTKEGDGDIFVDKDWIYRTLTTKQFPNDTVNLTSFDFYDMFFDRFGESTQQPVPCPFFVSLAIVVGDVEKDKEEALDKSRDDMRKVKKLGKDIIDENTALKERLVESKRNLTLIEQERQGVYKACFSVTLMENDKDKLDKYTKVFKDRFSQKNWVMEEEKFGNIALFVFLYSLPLQHHDLVTDFTKRWDILFTSNCAAMAPMLGNSNSSEAMIVYFDYNGQMSSYDNFKGDNYSEFKTGSSGSGKSYSQAYSHLMTATAGVKRIVIDCGHSYRRLCKSIGGTYIDVGGNPNISMNFYTNANTAKITDKEGKDTEEFVLVKDNSGQLKKTLHREEISGIVPIIGLMLGMNFVDTGKRQSAEDASLETFVMSAITNAVTDTFIQHQHKGKLEHTREILLQYHNDEKEKKNHKQAEMLYSVYKGLFEFADQKGSEYVKFNTPNNLDLSLDYIVLDTFGLRGRILDIVTVSLAFTAKSEFWKIGIKRKKMLDIDEGWMFKDNEIVAKIFEDNARTFRKSLSGQCFITQGIEDANGSPSMKALLGNSFHKFFLSQDGKDIDKTSKSGTYPMDAYELRTFKSIENKKPYWGEAMYTSKRTGVNSYIIKASRKTHWLCSGADPGGNAIFESLVEKHNLSIIEAIRYLAKRDEDPDFTDSDLLIHAKNYSEQSNLKNKEEEKMYWKKELESAFKEDRFRIKAEPIKDIKSGESASFEILNEIAHHDGTYSSFSKVSKFLDEFHLEEKVFKKMLEKTFSYFNDFKYDVNINISISEMRNNRILDILISHTEKYKMNNKVVVELAEPDRSVSHGEITAFIEKMHENGIRVALDNIGKNYPRLMYIGTLDIDIVKVNSELIIEGDTESDCIAKETFKFIKALTSCCDREKKIIVTKIEDKKYIPIIQDSGIMLVQGFINKNEIVYF